MTRALTLEVESDFSAGLAGRRRGRTAPLRLACALPAAARDVSRRPARAGSRARGETAHSSAARGRARPRRAVAEIGRAPAEAARLDGAQAESARPLEQAVHATACARRRTRASPPARARGARRARVRERYEAQLATQAGMLEELRARHRDEVARLREEERAAATALREGQERVERTLSTLLGSNQKRGALGEGLVKRVHDGLRLGVLTPNAHQRLPGYGDATWSYAAPGGPPLSALVEVKLSHSADSTADVDKFLKDVDVGVRTDRVNAALYLSLAERLGGRPRLDLELVHGVPVLWAARAPTTTYRPPRSSRWPSTRSPAWPALRARDGDGGALREVGALLNAQLDEVARLDPRVAFLEKTADQMRREAAALRKTREALAARVANFQATHPALHARDEEVDELEARTLEAIRAHHARKKGYYPKHADDLRGDLDPEPLAALLRRPALFQECERRVRAEKQQTKRRRKEDAEE